MSLSPGTRIGAYEVIALLGAGGMGEVYRARDTKLNRDGALKVLPDAFALEPDRLARFRREAQVLAALNHPNIAAIYGFEDGTVVGAGFSRLGGALVLELIEGPTLADRIAEGPLPWDEALPIAKQIADAVGAAHEHGIVHRDLKPANIKVREDGTVKVLDFGLAKALERETASGDASKSPTVTAAATQLGVVLGTAAYMAPEQARGNPVDRRADIWAFGWRNLSASSTDALTNDMRIGAYQVRLARFRRGSHRRTIALRTDPRKQPRTDERREIAPTA